MSISERIHERLERIAEQFEPRVLEAVPELRRLSRAALLDHLPEFLTSLAAWVDGNADAAKDAFDALCMGHALQRLGFGIDLESVTMEYSILRGVLIETLFINDVSPGLRLHTLAFHHAMDRAVGKAVRRYMGGREEIRERFVGILGHDLRTPLSAIVMSAAQLLHAHHLSEDDRKSAARIATAAERMHRMINDVMDFARGHLGGGIPATPTAGDIGEMCSATVEELRQGYPERAIVLVAEGDLRGTWDRDRVIQALSNVVSNALQYGEGTVEVTARALGDDAVITEVFNRGRPIPEELLPRLFDPFKSRAGPGGGGGLGLGLYIVQQIVLAHGARCAVSSSRQGGTRFSITWPRTLPEQTPGRP